MQIKMQVSPFGVHLVSEFESLSLTAYRRRYKNKLDVWTIGYGHTGPEVHEAMVVTVDQALQLLHADLASATDDVNRLVRIQLNQNQFDALVSLVFNIGGGQQGFAGSSLLKLLNAGEIIAAAAQFPRWDKVDGVEEKGLLSRRLLERDLFLSPVTQN